MEAISILFVVILCILCLGYYFTTKIIFNKICLTIDSLKTKSLNSQELLEEEEVDDLDKDIEKGDNLIALPLSRNSQNNQEQVTNIQNNQEQPTVINNNNNNDNNNNNNKNNNNLNDDDKQIIYNNGDLMKANLLRFLCTYHNLYSICKSQQVFPIQPANFKYVTLNVFLLHCQLNLCVSYWLVVNDSTFSIVWCLVTAFLGFVVVMPLNYIVNRIVQYASTIYPTINYELPSQQQTKEMAKLHSNQQKQEEFEQQSLEQAKQEKLENYQDEEQEEKQEEKEGEVLFSKRQSKEQLITQQQQQSSQKQLIQQESEKQLSQQQSQQNSLKDLKLESSQKNYKSQHGFSDFKMEQSHNVLSQHQKSFHQSNEKKENEQEKMVEEFKEEEEKEEKEEEEEEELQIQIIENNNNNANEQENQQLMEYRSDQHLGSTGQLIQPKELQEQSQNLQTIITQDINQQLLIAILFVCQNMVLLSNIYSLWLSPQSLSLLCLLSTLCSLLLDYFCFRLFTIPCLTTVSYLALKSDSQQLQVMLNVFSKNGYPFQYKQSNQLVQLEDINSFAEDDQNSLQQLDHQFKNRNNNNDFSNDNNNDNKNDNNNLINNDNNNNINDINNNIINDKDKDIDINNNNQLLNSKQLNDQQNKQKDEQLNLDGLNLSLSSCLLQNSLTKKANIKSEQVDLHSQDAKSLDSFKQSRMRLGHTKSLKHTAKVQVKGKHSGKWQGGKLSTSQFMVLQNYNQNRQIRGNQTMHLSIDRIIFTSPDKSHLSIINNNKHTLHFINNYSIDQHDNNTLNQDDSQLQQLNNLLGPKDKSNNKNNTNNKNTNKNINDNDNYSENDSNVKEHNYNSRDTVNLDDQPLQKTNQKQSPQISPIKPIKSSAKKDFKTEEAILAEKLLAEQKMYLIDYMNTLKQNKKKQEEEEKLLKNKQKGELLSSIYGASTIKKKTQHTNRKGFSQQKRTYTQQDLNSLYNPEIDTVYDYDQHLPQQTKAKKNNSQNHSNTGTFQSINSSKKHRKVRKIKYNHQVINNMSPYLEYLPNMINEDHKTQLLSTDKKQQLSSSQKKDLKKQKLTEFQNTFQQAQLPTISRTNISNLPTRKETQEQQKQYSREKQKHTDLSPQLPYINKLKQSVQNHL